MKKLFSFVLVALMMLFSMSVTTGCSDKDILDPNLEPEPEETPSENLEEKPDIKPEGGESGEVGGIEIPPAVLEKVKAIYSKASIGPQKVTTVNQLAILTSICATRKGDGPISVTKASLNGKKITLVTLGGTEDVEGQATTMEESQLAAFGKSNDYLKAVVKLFETSVIPKDRPVMVTGISLGGMIAQQLIGQTSIVDEYAVRAIVTFGSPLTLPLDRQYIRVVRFADVHDKVPSLGEMVLRMGMLTVNELTPKELTQKLKELDGTEKIACVSKYTDMIETHALSYIEDTCWSETDFLGDVEKKNVLVLEEDMKFYPAPKLETK